MRIGVEEARQYWAHASQQKGSMLSPEDLPCTPDFQYWAHDGVCGVFHLAPWPGVWMGHYGIKPEMWGKAVGPARRVIEDFRNANSPDLIVGWTHEGNRAALSFARRLGFVETGRMNLPTGAVIMQELK